MLTPHKIEARLACRVVEDLRQRGVLADDLLKEVGLRRADVADPEARIPYAAFVGPRKRAATGVFPRVGGQSGHLETGRPLFFVAVFAVAAGAAKRRLRIAHRKKGQRYDHPLDGDKLECDY